MASAKPWTPDLRRASGPRYLAIADALANDLANGRLAPGQWLPTHRTLAEALGVDLTTVTRAYREAQRRGLTEAVVGRGTFVRGGEPREPPRAPPRPALDLTMNLPPQPAEAHLPERLAQGLAAVQARSDILSLLTYRQSGGGLADRTAGASLLRDRLGTIAADRVLVCAGAQAAMLVLIGTLVPRGRAIVTEAVTYPGLRALAGQLNVPLVGVPLDAEGLIPDALEAVCRREKPAALYCVPTIHNPTTATMSMVRRKDIATIARRHDLLLFEDDAYGLLPREAPPPLSSFAPERGFHVAGLSKCIAPGLRLAYLVAPDANLAARLAQGMRATTLMTAPLLAALATQWIGDGTAQATIAAIRKDSAARQRLARKLLPAGRFVAHPEGHHLWLTLPEGFSRIEFAAQMRQQGLAVVAGDAFTVAGPVPNAVRVSLGASDGDRLQPALIHLAEAMSRGPGSLSDVI